METQKEKIQKLLDESRRVLDKLDVEIIIKLAEKIIVSLKTGGKVIAFGNGGSASDAQHLVAELVGRFEKERPAMAAVALNTNTSTITALGNDYGYEKVFARQIEAIAKKGDVVLAISTSGNSPNVLKAVESARQAGCFIAGLTGKDGGRLANCADLCLRADSNKTADIQLLHIASIHILCYLLESR